MAPVFDLTLSKFIPSGESFGIHEGREVLAWGALPGEAARVRVVGRKKGVLHTVADDIIVPSPHRIPPREPAHYLSCSPWSIMSYGEELRSKATLVRDLFDAQGILLPFFDVKTDNVEFGYRTNMEYPIVTGADGKPAAAYFHRGTHFREPIEPCLLARPAINTAFRVLIDFLDANGISSKQLKTAILKSNRLDETIIGLFVTDENFPALPWQHIVGDDIRGIVVYYSNPLSPASVADRVLGQVGTPELVETINGLQFTFGITSFFQINAPMIELALDAMQPAVPGSADLLDLYSGVGTIGFCLAARARQVTSVETVADAIAFAKHNADANRLTNVEVIHSPAERALDYITPDRVIILDPPRVGLHPKLVRRLLDVRPVRLIYLSCNPSTQARDLGILASAYRLTSFDAFNFFPRTPHVETLAVLEKR